MAHTCSDMTEMNLFENEIKQELSEYPISFIDPLPLAIACHIGPGALAIACTVVDQSITK